VAAIQKYGHITHVVLVSNYQNFANVILNIAQRLKLDLHIR